MGLFLVLCCLFPIVYGENPRNLPQTYEPERIKFIEGERLNIKQRREQTRSLSNCSYFNGNFLCKDELRCIDLEEACNGACDCSDCSDESEQCWIYDEKLCRSCYHLCLPTPDGPQCICDAVNFNLSPVCKEISECTKDSNCDQRCVRYEVLDRCTCDENYRGMPHSSGRSCINDVFYENRLLYSTEDKIKLFNFTGDKDMVVRDSVICKGLAAAHDDFYYGLAEKNSGYIFKTSIVTGETKIVTETHSTLIFSIDVDWITGNVYFSTDKSLAVCSNDGHFCALIKQLQIHDSCHISVAPRSGLLFYSLRSIYHFYQDSQIMKSGMDGSGGTLLVSEGLRHPMALTVDEPSQKLYWMDCDLGEVESIEFNGNNRKIWFSEKRMHIFTISKFEKHIFWTEESKNTIGFDFEENSKVIVDKNASTVKYLYAYNPLLQKTNIRNPCEKAPCNGLCLLRPSQSEILTYTCLCDDYTPSSNQLWCNNHTARADWREENDFEYEVRGRPRSSPSSATKWFNFGVLIILASIAAFLVYRRRTVYRYYDRVCNWNWDREELINLNEYEEL